MEKLRIAVENQYRCMRVDMLEILLVKNSEDKATNLLRKVPDNYRELWADRLDKQRILIQDGIDNNINTIVGDED